ncbi:MAG: RidA family protein [Candidatus Aminicenantes bacterium]|nr:RidA family protein [Candidatus Aminicenantes bacterium]
MTKRTALALIGLLAAPVPLLVSAAAPDQTKTAIQTEKAPKAVGPYSQGIMAGGLIFCAGQIPIDPATGKLVPGGIEDQTRQVLKNLAAVLEAGGSSLDDVVKCTVILTDMAEFGAMNKVYAEFFKTPYPARATFQSGALALGAKVEIECFAVRR